MHGERGLLVRRSQAIFLSMCVATVMMTTAQEWTLERFRELPEATQVTVFQQLSADQKAALMRAHATDWLNRNGASLRPYQIDAVRAGIDFVKAEIYASPRREDLRDEEERVKRRIGCALGSSRAQQAFSLTRTTDGPDLDRSLVEHWLSWFSDCLLR